MDGIFNKIGLYEFFGVLLPGITVEILLLLVKCPIIYELNIPSSQIFQIIIFLVVGHIIGTLVQEISSYIDKKVFKMREKSMRFLCEDSHIFDKQEFKIMEKFGNEVLGKSEDEKFTEDTCRELFYKCKAYLENENKMNKADELDAIYSMSRNFVISNFLCLFVNIPYICLCCGSVEYILHTILLRMFLLGCLGISILLFYRRARRYVEMRVRTILRQYKDLYDRKTRDFITNTDKK